MAEDKAKEEIKEQTPDKPVDKMTAKELRAVAKDIPGVTGVHAMKKDELLAVVKESMGIKDEKPKRKKAPKSVLSVKELKEKIIELRKMKKAAREAGDRHGVDVARRRINRLKKRTRKVAMG